MVSRVAGDGLIDDVLNSIHCKTIGLEMFCVYRVEFWEIFVTQSDKRCLLS